MFHQIAFRIRNFSFIKTYRSFITYLKYNFYCSYYDYEYNSSFVILFRISYINLRFDQSIDVHMINKSKNTLRCSFNIHRGKCLYCVSWSKDFKTRYCAFCKCYLQNWYVVRFNLIFREFIGKLSYTHVYFQLELSCN